MAQEIFSLNIPEALENQLVEMVQAVFGVEAALFVDHETALRVAFRVQAALYAFHERNILDLQHFVDIFDGFRLGLRRLCIEEIEIELFECCFGAGRHDVQGRDVGRSGEDIERHIRQKPPGGKIAFLSLWHLIGLVIGLTGG